MAGILEVLADHGVPFVVIGGHAVGCHGYVRAIRRMTQAAGRPKDLEDLERLAD